MVWPASAAESTKAAVLISRKILPYMAATEALSSVLSTETAIEVEIFFLEKFSRKGSGLLKERLEKGGFSLVVVVGPEAARFCQKQFPEPKLPIVYSMVLNPDEILKPGSAICGVPLSIPVKLQLNRISMALPSVKRIGLIYDPFYNTDFFSEAKQQGLTVNIEIVPLKVSSKKEIPKVLKNSLNHVDCLWLIPDRTVISESIIQYIIKEALLKEKPVIGYNRFFYESGAVLTFIFDYHELGQQTAGIVKDVILNGLCRNIPASFHTWVNVRVAEKIGLTVDLNASSVIEKGP
jgi:putative ABC transport system substrate-binding protein